MVEAGRGVVAGEGGGQHRVERGWGKGGCWAGVGGREAGRGYYNQWGLREGGTTTSGYKGRREGATTSGDREGGYYDQWGQREEGGTTTSGDRGRGYYKRWGAEGGKAAVRSSGLYCFTRKKNK